jgi:hypothetical protein
VASIARTRSVRSCPTAVTTQNRHRTNQKQNKIVDGPLTLGPSPTRTVPTSRALIRAGAPAAVLSATPLDHRNRATGSQFRPGEPHCGDLVVGYIGADLTLGLVREILQLGQELIDPARSTRRPTGNQCPSLPIGHITGPPCSATPGQFGGIAQRPVRSNPSRISMISSAYFTCPLLGGRQAAATPAPSSPGSTGDQAKSARQVGMRIGTSGSH